MVNIFNAYDMWRNRREDRTEKLVAEATDFTYEVFVRELKENDQFTKEKQKEAMAMVFDYVQDRIGYDYSDRTIKVLVEQRILLMKARMVYGPGISGEAKQLFDDERQDDKNRFKVWTKAKRKQAAEINFTETSQQLVPQA
mmetsp:Transcript_57862/g.95984  ORF Transcript_57862/g.95984 Transcript_57862/m.95984 type:complete len:141 (+) Transcript_57862:2-424(+)